MASYRIKRVYSDELYHFGRLGQKWGVRNGPPYPLGASPRNLNKKVTQNDSNYKGLHLTDNQKKWIKIGAKVVAAGLISYGSYKLSTNPKFKSLVSKVMDKKIDFDKLVIDDLGPDIIDKKTGQKVDIDKIIEERGPEIFDLNNGKIGAVSDQINQLEDTLNVQHQNLTPSEKTFLDQVSKANPNYDREKAEWKNSCVHTSISGCLRIMGFPVKAKPMAFDEIGGLSFNEIGRYFSHFSEKDGNVKRNVHATSYSDIADSIKQLCNNENGACGIIELNYKTGGNHAIIWQNIDGNILVGDGNNAGRNARSYFRLINTAISPVFNIARLDTCEVKINAITEVVEKE